MSFPDSSVGKESACSAGDLGLIPGLGRTPGEGKVVGSGVSLVVQWLRIHLPMQGTRVQSLVWEDSTCCGAVKPCTTTTELAL